MLATALPPLQALKLDNLGEVLIAGGLVWAIARFPPVARPPLGPAFLGQAVR
jgi:hypothetical protein